MDAITAQASMKRPMVPSQQAVQVCGYKGFDAQWLQITGMLVLTQDLSSEDIKASHNSQAGRGHLCVGLTPLLTHCQNPAAINLYACIPSDMCKTFQVISM